MTSPLQTASAIELVDTTLRDGEQTPGVAFSARRKQQLATMLAEAGVPELEVGTPAMGADEVRVIRGIVRQGLPCRVTAWCRATAGDLDAAAAAGVSAVHISVPTSQIHLQVLAKDYSWLFGQLERIVGRALRVFDFVSVGAQDASRSDPALLVELAQVVAALGAQRLRLADTVGVWSPQLTASTVAAVREAVPGIAVGIHAHNDLGMATANTVAAVAAGATSADVTVLGIGERAGNAALEEVVMALRHIHGIDLDIRTSQLSQLARFVAKTTGHRIACNKPIVGKNAFRHESGLHVHGMVRDRTAYQAFAAEEVGATSRMVLGRHTGTGSLQHALARWGVPAPAATTARWSRRLRRLAKSRLVRVLLGRWEFDLP